MGEQLCETHSRVDSSILADYGVSAVSLFFIQSTDFVLGHPSTLALVCLIRSQTFEERRGLIEYNVAFFRGAVHRVVKVELAKRHGASTS